jgi:indolepyruvate ferredoxin oxidoreductase alpha subunit
MIGNEAIAQGAWEAGATVAAAYPGTPSTEILEFFARYPQVYAEWAPNEKVALEVGAGASLGGARTLVAMKHVGVNVAADPLFTLSYTGVNAGLVLISADDPGMHSSQNEQDNRGYGRFAKLPVLEPSDSQEARDFVKLAFELSERFDTPVMVRLTTRIAHSQSLVEVGEREAVELKPYAKDAAKYVMLPGNARLRHLEVEKRMAALREFADDTALNRIEWGTRERGIVTSGAAYQYVREVMPDASVLKLGLVNPLPERLVREFAAGVGELVVVEELEPVIEEQLRAWGLAARGKDLLPRTGEFSPELLAERLLGRAPTPAYSVSAVIPPRPPLMCPGCPHRGVFYTLGRMHLTVCGDIGCYTLGALKPLAAMDTTICMGASIGAALGMEKARGPEWAQKTVAVIGDSTFVHSGITPLIDVVYNGGATTVLILDNGTTAMTGHQQHPATGRTLAGAEAPRLDLEQVCRAVGVRRVRQVDPLDLAGVEAALKEELAVREPSVIIARRPCALLPEAALGQRTFRIDPDKCKGCKLCVRLGCTGVSWDEETRLASINPDLCVGCGLCLQVCKLDAVLEGRA